MLHHLRFCRSTSGSGDNLLREAAKAVEEHCGGGGSEGGEAVWLMEGEEHEGEKGCIYIMGDFDNSFYKSLHGNYRIVGPSVIMAHVQHGWPLPASTQPVFSMAMHGVVACFTQVGSKDTRERLTQLIKLMGGKVEGDFTKRVTHLIVGQVGSTKYNVARQLKLPVMLPSWVESTWEAGLINHVTSATSDDIIATHRCPPLKGHTITVTGLDERARQGVKELCAKNGGTYSGELTKDICTHLLVGNKQSMKYRYAKQWGIHCVSAQWFHDSVEAGYSMPEADYDVDKEQGGAGEGGESANGTSRKRNLEDTDITNDQECKRPRTEPNHDDITDNETPPPGIVRGEGVLGEREVSVSHLFSEEDRRIAKGEIWTHGGCVVSQQKGGGYHLLPLEVSLEHVPKTEATLVTMIWLQRCIEDNVVLDPASYFLFRPITTPISDSTLSDCVLAFSQFSDLEREHLVRFGKRLGATVQDHFARYPGHGLLATTHLLLKTGNGEKFSCALKWGIPAISDEWLFACAMAQKIVPVSSFIIQSEAEQTTTQTASTTAASKPHSNSDMGMDISSRPHSDSDMRMETGNEEVEQEEPGDNHPLSSVVLCFSKKVAAQESHLSKVAVSLGAECRHRLDKTCTHYIYHGKSMEAVRDKEVKMAKESGCFVVSPHWITACSERGSRVHESDYPHTYNPNMALGGILQTQSALPSSQSQTKNNRVPLQPTRSSPIPNPTEKPESDHSSNDSSEPTKTQQNEDQENENGIPIEVAKQLQQHLEELREAPREQQRRRRSRRLAKKGSEDAMGQLPPPPLPPPSHGSPGKGRGRRGRRVRRKEEHLMDSQVTDSQLLQVTYDDPVGRKEKEKLLARVEREEQLRAKGVSSADTEASKSNNAKADPEVMEVTQPPQEERSSNSTNTATQQKRGMASMRKPDPVVINDRDLPSSTPVPPPLNIPIVTHSARPTEVQSLYDERVQTRVKKAPPKFLLSSLDQREKVDYGALIQDLGGEYIDQDYFTTKCTHLVVGKASRTEKYLGACAAGKWVLHKSYLEECRQAKRFVEEHHHEWGERVSGGGEVSPLEAAPRRWRLALANKNTGAFEGWKVMLFVERNKLPGLKRLLEAGGAQVVTRITAAVLREVTHAFIAISHFPKELSLEQLAKLGVQCLKPDYIAEYLSKGEVQAEAFYINEVKPFLTKLR